MSGEIGKNGVGHEGLAAPAQIDAGGAALDTADEKDRAAIRRAMTRWPRRFRAINDTRKDEWVEGLDIAGRVAREEISKEVGEKIEAAKVLVSVAKTGTMMERLHQADDHKESDQMEKAGVVPAGTTVNVNVQNNGQANNVFEIQFDRAG